MEKQEQIELLLKCRSQEIEVEQLLSRLDVPVSGYSKFLCNEVLFWEIDEEQLLNELMLAREPFLQTMIEDLKNLKISNSMETLQLAKSLGFTYIEHYVPELLKNIADKDPSVCSKVTIPIGVVIDKQGEDDDR